MDVEHAGVELGHAPEAGMISDDDEGDEDEEGDELVVSSLDEEELLCFGLRHLPWLTFDAVAAAAEQHG